MSAYYALAYEDRVEIATDGAIYEDDGTIIDLRYKAWHSDTLPLAWAGRGNSIMVDGVGLMLSAVSFMGSVDWALERFQEAIARNERLLEIPFDGVIGSISDAGVPQLHWFTTYDGFEGFNPLVLYEVGKEWAGAPQPHPSTLADYGFPERMATSTLGESAGDLFEALRATRMQHLAHPDQPWIYGVGGHVDLTTVRADGCTTERLRTWPQDVVGEKIDPAREGREPEWLKAA